MQPRWSLHAQRLSYGALILLILSTFCLFLLFIWSSAQFKGIWQVYTYIYIILLAINSWYILVLLAIHDHKKQSSHKLADELITVVIPSFNEPPELLAKTVDSVLHANGNTKVVIVDDGSTNNSGWLMDLLGERQNVTVHHFDQNSGKREALHYAITHLVDPKSYCVVTIDSDTILEPNAITCLVGPLLDQRVGATTGNVLLLNEKQNLLTRMVGTYYWMGLNIYKQAQSAVNNVVCCSGCLSAYRTDLLLEIIDEFNTQTFLGEKATHSEDRHLTNLILQRGYRVEYVEEAICYTETPATLPGFCRQQLRWKRGYVRESLYTLSYAWRNQKKLFFQILTWDLTSPYFTFGIRMYMAVLFFFSPSYFVLVIVPFWFFAVFLRYILVALRAPQKLFGLFMYAFFFELILYWVNLYALFTVRNKRWVTRGV
jgi:hyaluronan synthase